MTRAQKFKFFQENLANFREQTKDTELGISMAKFSERLKEVTAKLEAIEKDPESWPQEKAFRTPNGDLCIVWDNKFHSWDEPAFVPEGDFKRAEYYLYGIPYSFEEWKEMKKQWEGLPWYKTPSILADAGTARN